MKIKNILLSQFPVFGIYFLYSWNKIGKWSPREFLYEIDLSALQSGIGFKLVLEVTLDHPIPPSHSNTQKIQTSQSLSSYNLFQLENLALRIISSLCSRLFRFGCKRTRPSMTSRFEPLVISEFESSNL